MADQAIKNICLAFNPVNHITTIGSTGRAQLFLIDKSIIFPEVINGIDQVTVWFSSPVATDGIGESLTIAWTPMKVDQ